MPQPQPAGSASPYTVSLADPSAIRRLDENWMTQTRFGMFVTFGLYSIPGGVWQGEQMGRNLYAEWIRAQWRWPQHGCGIPKEDYDTLLARFNPVNFDADEWARLAAEAGMRYLVITTKHHDGFALWDSAVSRYTIAATPFGATGRDLLGELADACRRHGVRPGFYYSHWQDWEHPGGARPPWPEAPGDPPAEQPDDAAFARYWEEKSLPQVAELIERYEPEMFWFDTWNTGARNQVTPARRDQLLQLIHDKAPRCLVNGRIAAHNPAGADFLSMGDNEYPGGQDAPGVPWETPGTMNRSWGWHRLDHSWQPFGALLDRLITNAHHGGAVTLNAGPLPDGSLPKAARRRLREFAAWMEINGAAIQPSDRSPFAEGALPPNVRATAAPGPGSPCVCLFILPPVQSGGMAIPQPPGLAEPGAAFQAQVLETHQKLPVRPDGAGGLIITIPPELAGVDHPVIRLWPADAGPARDEDGQPAEPVKPAAFYWPAPV